MYISGMGTVRKHLVDLLASGLSQTEIARAVGLTQPSISRLLRGVSMDTLSENARAIEELHRSKIVPTISYDSRIQQA
jgi:transcriptional regulator with XRE-family HTH domain